MACLLTTWLVAIQNLTNYFLSTELMEQRERAHYARVLFRCAATKWYNFTLEYIAIYIILHIIILTKNTTSFQACRHYAYLDDYLCGIKMGRYVTFENFYLFVGWFIFFSSFYYFPWLRHVTVLKVAQVNELHLVACWPFTWLVAIQNLNNYFLSKVLFERSDKSKRSHVYRVLIRCAATKWYDSTLEYIAIYIILHRIILTKTQLPSRLAIVMRNLCSIK